MAKYKFNCFCSISLSKRICITNSAIGIHGRLVQCGSDTSVNILIENRWRHRISSHESILQRWLFHLQRGDFMSRGKFHKTLAQKDERLLKNQAHTTFCLSRSVALWFKDYLILWTWSINSVIMKCGKGQNCKWQAIRSDGATMFPLFSTSLSHHFPELRSVGVKG